MFEKTKNQDQIKTAYKNIIFRIFINYKKRKTTAPNFNYIIKKNKKHNYNFWRIFYQILTKEANCAWLNRE